MQIKRMNSNCSPSRAWALRLTVDTQGDQSFSGTVSLIRGLMTCSQTGQMFFITQAYDLIMFVFSGLSLFVTSSLRHTLCSFVTRRTLPPSWITSSTPSACVMIPGNEVKYDKDSLLIFWFFRLNELMTKAFFDLKKNYGFKWNMSLCHVLTCLINFGADEAVVFNERFFQKHLEKHFDAVRRSGQKIIKKYELPSLPDFIKRRRSENSYRASVSAAQFRHCLICRGV